MQQDRNYPSLSRAVRHYSLHSCYASGPALMEFLFCPRKHVKQESSELKKWTAGGKDSSRKPQQELQAESPAAGNSGCKGLEWGGTGTPEAGRVCLAGSVLGVGTMGVPNSLGPRNPSHSVQLPPWSWVPSGRAGA